MMPTSSSLPVADAEPITSWASRNPSLSTQPSRVRSSNNTDASRKTGSHKNKNTKANLEIIQGEINAYLTEQTDFIDELANKYAVDAHLIKKKLVHSSNYKSTRAPHTKRDYSPQNDGGRAPGDRLKLREIQKLVDEDQSLRYLSKERKGELIKTLEDHRALHTTGACAGNHAACLDTSKNIEMITHEIKNMYLRTGVRTIAFFTRSHVNDNIVPVVSASDDPALKFFPEVQARYNGTSAKADTLPSMRADCTRLILDGLSEEMLNNKKIVMNYANFETVIVEAHHVRLVGWPQPIPFGSPSNLSTMDDVRALRAALEEGDCKWELLNAEQRRTHSRSLRMLRRKEPQLGRRGRYGGTRERLGSTRRRGRSSELNRAPPPI
ncbi:hypothetical protein Hypma_005472 [Hypsizygus marmoreus]|uniref:Uncharacterized protein n=1 Tax=Hypsizygus marmoreus TaxID=39966 RepID=A0A369J3R2_HYPMA|nr:hypothetical protein Hypma_005472 [Hypsizygus marmoreus]